MKTLQQIYDKIPKIACKGKCHQSCGPIHMSRIEQEKINDKYGITDFSLEGALERKCLTCPKLVKQRCSIYIDRPLICRLFGVVKRLRCPWGCKPKRWLSDAEASEMIKACDNLGKN